MVAAEGLPLGRMIGTIGEAADVPLVVVVVAGVLLLLLIRRVASWPGPRSARGEIWFAEVPFADGTGSKDRPVLVLAVQGDACTVARFTSRDRSAHRDYRRVPVWLPGLCGTSWADLRPITLRRGALRRRVARSDAALLLWYEQQSGWSAAA